MKKTDWEGILVGRIPKYGQAKRSQSPLFSCSNCMSCRVKNHFLSICSLKHTTYHSLCLTKVKDINKSILTLARPWGGKPKKVVNVWTHLRRMEIGTRGFTAKCFPWCLPIMRFLKVLAKKQNTQAQEDWNQFSSFKKKQWLLIRWITCDKWWKKHHSAIKRSLPSTGHTHSPAACHGTSVWFLPQPLAPGGCRLYSHPSTTFSFQISMSTSSKTNITTEIQPLEDVSPLKNGDVPLPCWFSGGYLFSLNARVSKFWKDQLRMCFYRLGVQSECKYLRIFKRWEYDYRFGAAFCWKPGTCMFVRGSTWIVLWLWHHVMLQNI